MMADLDARPDVWEGQQHPGYGINPPPEDEGPTNGGSVTPPVAPEPTDPWTRLGDLLAGIEAPSVALPSPVPQTVSYVEGGGGMNPMAIILLLVAAGGAFWWYQSRKAKKPAGGGD